MVQKLKSLKTCQALKHIHHALFLGGETIIPPDTSICSHHYAHFIEKFEKHQTKCCDPWKKHSQSSHKKSTKSSIKKLVVLSYDDAVEMNKLLAKDSRVAAGMKVCRKVCWTYYQYSIELKCDPNFLGSLSKEDRKSTRLNSSHPSRSRMPSSA